MARRNVRPAGPARKSGRIASPGKPHQRCPGRRLPTRSSAGHRKQPKLKPNQAKHLLELHDLGGYSTAGWAELFGVGRSTIYRTLKRLRPTREPERPFAHLTNEHPTDRA